MKKKWLKTIALATALAMLCAGFAFAAEVPADVSGSAYEEAVTALFEADVITGDEDGLFHPTDPLTRAQACVIIVKAMEPPDADLFGTATQDPPASGFSDMRGYGWAEPYISYAARHDIVKGYPDGTFRPGSDVTSNEMLTMVLRAIGYTDDLVGPSWPGDHIAKAREVGVTSGIAELPKTATKEIAARMTYNKLDELRAQGAPEEPPEEPAKEPEDSADGDEGEMTSAAEKGLTYATGKFNNNMTTFAGKEISPKVEVYTYSVRSAYKRDMELPEDEGKLREDTIHKFKNAETPAFYREEGGRITYMILPMDAGFSGRIHCVIVGGSTVVNGKGDVVSSLHTLAAGQPIRWLAKDDSITDPSSSPLDGTVYELAANNGTIQNVWLSKEGSSHKSFIELTTTNKWTVVDSFSNNVIHLPGGNLIAVDAKAVVYVLSDDGKSYTVGRLRDIKADDSIRAYSISEDQEIAGIITLKKK